MPKVEQTWRRIADALCPPPLLPLSDWLERHIRLPLGLRAEGGPLHLWLTPHTLSELRFFWRPRLMRGGAATQFRPLRNIRAGLTWLKSFSVEGPSMLAGVDLYAAPAVLSERVSRHRYGRGRLFTLCSR